jgi:hypothetical protein
MFFLNRGERLQNEMLHLAVHTLVYTNSAIHFVFYGLSSKKYREELKSIFCSQQNQNNLNVNGRSTFFFKKTTTKNIFNGGYSVQEQTINMKNIVMVPDDNCSLLLKPAQIEDKKL